MSYPIINHHHCRICEDAIAPNMGICFNKYCIIRIEAQIKQVKEEMKLAKMLVKENL